MATVMPPTDESLRKEILELDAEVRSVVQLPSTSKNQRAELTQRLRHLKLRAGI